MKTIETFEQPGDVVTLVAPYDVTGGDGLLVGIIFGIAAYQVASGTPVETCTTGVFRINALSTDVGAQGAAVYWDNTNRRVTTSSSGNTAIGALVVAKQNGSAVAVVRVVSADGIEFSLTPQVNAKAVCLGDSFSARYLSSGIQQMTSLHAWLNAMLGDRFTITGAGVAGNTTAQMLARFDTDVKPYSPRVVFILGGINDVSAGTASATTISNLAAIVAKVRGIGAIPVIWTVPLSTSVVTTTAKGQLLYEINQGIRAMQGVSALVADGFQAWISATNTTAPGTNATGMALASDSLHPTAKGAYQLARPAYDLINAAFPAINRLKSTSYDYDNLIPNGHMLGGTASGTWSNTLGTGFSGTGPNLWSISRTGSSIAATCSKVARTDWRNSENWRVAMSAAAGADYENFTITQPVLFRYWSAGGAVSSGRSRFHVPSTGCQYEVISNGGSLSGAADPTATWPTVIGATFTDGSVTLRCVVPFRSGDTVRISAEVTINTVAAGQIAPQMRAVFKRNDNSTIILDSYALAFTGATDETLPTLSNGQILVIGTSELTLPADWDVQLAAITGSTGPRFDISITISTQNLGSGTVDFGPCRCSHV